MSEGKGTIMQQTSLNIGTIGQKLESARQSKGVSISEAGEATKILSKLIKAMEADDFGALSAPVYAKGFIKMYAQYLGLDARPLVDEYMAQHAPKSKVPLPEEVKKKLTKMEPVPLESPSPTSSPGGVLGRVSDTIQQTRALGGSSFKWILTAVGAITLTLIVLSTTQCVDDEAEAPAASGGMILTERPLITDGIPNTYLVKPGVVDVDPN